MLLVAIYFPTKKKRIINRDCGSTLYVGLQHAVPPTYTKFKPLLLPTQAGIPYTNAHKHRNYISSLHSHFWVQLNGGSPYLPPDKKRKFLRFFIINIIIRECSSTLYVGLQHAVLPTNTKFKLLFLPTQVGMPYTNTHKHRTLYSSLHSHSWVQLSTGSSFLLPNKNRKFLHFFIINIIITSRSSFLFNSDEISPWSVNK